MKKNEEPLAGKLDDPVWAERMNALQKNVVYALDQLSEHMEANALLLPSPGRGEDTYILCGTHEELQKLMEVLAEIRAPSKGNVVKH